MRLRALAALFLTTFLTLALAVPAQAAFLLIVQPDGRVDFTSSTDSGTDGHRSTTDGSFKFQSARQMDFTLEVTDLCGSGINVWDGQVRVRYFSNTTLLRTITVNSGDSTQGACAQRAQTYGGVTQSARVTTVKFDRCEYNRSTGATRQCSRTEVSNTYA